VKWQVYENARSGRAYLVALPVGGVGEAPVTAVVQPVIKRKRQGRGGRPGPHAGLCTAHVEKLNSWQRAMRVGVVR